VKTNRVDDSSLPATRQVSEASFAQQAVHNGANSIELSEDANAVGSLVYSNSSNDLNHSCNHLMREGSSALFVFLP
jgi:hypothetical protein